MYINISRMRPGGLLWVCGALSLVLGISSSGMLTTNHAVKRRETPRYQTLKDDCVSKNITYKDLGSHMTITATRWVCGGLADCDGDTRSDQSICCQTCSGIDQVWYIVGGEVTLYPIQATWNDSYQIVETGTCGDHKSCIGECRQQHAAVTLLVSDLQISTGKQFKRQNSWFEEFKFPSRCICVNPGESEDYYGSGQKIMIAWTAILFSLLVALYT